MKNESGIQPTEFKVLVLPEEVSDAHTFKGLDGREFKLLKADTTKETEKHATQDGTIVAHSPLAFTYASPDEWERAGATPPKQGDRVAFARYAGVVRKGKDGKEYRIISDKDIYAVIA